MCILGPMTNLAMSLVKAPEIAHAIDKVVAMGGAYFEVGNITPAAEFNIYVDPEKPPKSSEKRYPSGSRPLDLTDKVLVTKERFNRIEAVGNKASHAVVQMLTFSEQFDRKKYGWDGVPLHDPCVIAYLLKPELFTGRTINVEVETNSELTRGMTVADWWRVTDRAPNCLFLEMQISRASSTCLSSGCPSTPGRRTPLPTEVRRASWHLPSARGHA